MNEAQAIENAAYAIYCQFIRGASGTLSYVRDDKGNIVVDGNDRPVKETYDQACHRRWNGMTEVSRESYRREAMAALSATGFSIVGRF